MASPDVTVLVALRDAMPNFLRGCIMVSGATLGKRHDDAAHLIAAEISGLRFATSDKAAEVSVTQQTTHAKPDDPARGVHLGQCDEVS